MRSRRRSDSARRRLPIVSSSGWPYSACSPRPRKNSRSLCVIDDAQWLDQASALTIAFVARRLLAESVGLVFAVRQPSEVRELAGLPELLLGGLRDGDARALLDAAWPGRLDEQVRDRVIAESRGNPLALLELPRGLTPAELAGGFELPDVAPLATQIEQSFLRQLESLPDETRLLLLTAAAEPVGDVALLWRAASLLGLGPDAAVASAGGGADRSRRTGAVPSSLWCARRSTGLRPQSTARWCIVRWPRRPIPNSNLIGAPGIAAMRLRARMSPSADELEQLRRTRAGSRRHRRCRRVPRASRRADPGSDAVVVGGLSPRPRRSSSRAHWRPRTTLLALADGVPPGRPRARPARSPARPDRVRAQSRQSTRRRCCSMQPSELAPHDVETARETYLEALGATIFAGRLAWRGRPAGRGRRRSECPPGTTSARDRPIFSSTAWRRGSRRATSPGSRRCGVHWMRSGETPEATRTTSCVGSGCRGSSRATCGTTRSGTSWPLRRSGSVASPARSPCLPLALGYRAVVHLHAGEFGGGSGADRGG